jgi:hypothetical protein
MVVLDGLRDGVGAIARSIVDEDVQEQLELMRDLLATATLRLRTPTKENLGRVARATEVAQQLETLTQVPGATTRGRDRAGRSPGRLT